MNGQWRSYDYARAYHFFKKGAKTNDLLWGLQIREKLRVRSAMMKDQLTGLALMNFHHEIPVDIDQVLRDFDPLNFCRILLAFN